MTVRLIFLILSLTFSAVFILAGSQMSNQRNRKLDRIRSFQSSLVVEPRRVDRAFKSQTGFKDLFQNFDFEELEKTLGVNDREVALREKLILGLTDFTVVEPKVAIGELCGSPPVLPTVSLNECTAHDAFTGLRAKPARIAHMIQFGFEVDVLEIMLNEIYDLVDVFFILESTKAHQGRFGKPLVWERVKHQSRFARFHDKTVHIILDDIDTAFSSSDKDSIWYVENLQERVRFTKFIEWNSKQSNPFSDDDLIGFGDTDEVPWRNNINLLKHCALKQPVVDIGIWFPVCRLDTAFVSDWPVMGHRYTLGDPTFYSLKEAKERLKAGTPPTRNRGRSGSFLLGGMHMTRHNFLPYMLLESITCTECGIGSLRKIIENKRILGTDIREAERIWSGYNIDALKGFVGRWKPIDEIDQNERTHIQKIPWFLSCNPDRYPYWWGRHDTRLDD